MKSVLGDCQLPRDQILVLRRVGWRKLVLDHSAILVSRVHSRCLGSVTVSVETFVGPPTWYLACPPVWGHPKYELGCPTKVSTETVNGPMGRLFRQLTERASFFAFAITLATYTSSLYRSLISWSTIAGHDPEGSLHNPSFSGQVTFVCSPSGPRRLWEAHVRTNVDFSQTSRSRRAAQNVS